MDWRRLATRVGPGRGRCGVPSMSLVRWLGLGHRRSSGWIWGVGVLGNLWRLLGTFWRPSGDLWGLLETGDVLETLGDLLETVGHLLETIADLRETLGDLLGDSWRPSGGLLETTGQCWRLAERCWGVTRALHCPTGGFRRLPDGLRVGKSNENRVPVNAGVHCLKRRWFYSRCECCSNRCSKIKPKAT